METQTDRRISADTHAALLLTAPLRKGAKGELAPLTVAEYGEVAGGLHGEGLRPGDLLLIDSSAKIANVLTHVSTKARAKITIERVRALLERGGQLALALSRWTSAGIWVVSRADASYPSRYKRKLGRSAPPIVYGVGSASLLERGGLAVVGSRKPDPVSERYTNEIGSWAARAGVQIVSGAARGVDEISMLACTDAGGTALGIVADGLMKLSTRREFREAILAQRMTLISSFDPDTGFTVPIAMARNRWIYALADRALVVACSEGSGGSWAGAIEALRHGARVYVRVGNPVRPGNDALAARGAIPAPDSLDDLWRDESMAASVTPKDISAAPQLDDVYALVSPALLRLLSVSMNAKQFATAAGLTKSQADAWLRRLMSEGRITKVKSMYHVADAARHQPTLFGPP